MLKICRQCQTSFEITDEDLQFYDKISPVFAGKKYNIPTPTMCPECRNQKRLAFRNERNLYSRNCAKCNKKIIAVHSPDKPYSVYCPDCFWSDANNALDYGMEYDFSRSFTDQFKELMTKVPTFSLVAMNVQNSDYVNLETDDKDCYLCFGGHFNEECLYNTYSLYGKNNVDNYWLHTCELCYECLNCENCYHCQYVEESMNLRDCYFCKSCIGCNNCFGCFGLNRKEYFLFNKELTKEEYEKEISKYLGTKEGIDLARKLSKENFERYPHKYGKVASCENSTGNYLNQCKNVTESYVADKGENLRYTYITANEKDALDITSAGWGELNYEMCSIANTNTCGFGSFVLDSDNVWYSQVCFNSNNLFGCVGLKKNEYCILNKQYTKEEYEEMVGKIIDSMTLNHLADASDSGQGQSISEDVKGSWGEYLNPTLSFYGYNESVAQDYYPLTKEEAISLGYNWSDYSADMQSNASFYEPNSDINFYRDENNAKQLLSGILKCEITGRSFRIIPQELAFYLKQNLPVPRRHPDQRHKDRMNLRNPMRMWDRKCMKCGVDIKTSYAPERKEIVYCEECYQEEIY